MNVVFVLGRIPEDLEVREVATSTTRELAKRGKDPAWSPAGDGAIAFVRVTDAGKEEIWLIQPDGTQERKIGSGGNPHWSGDGKTLYFHDHDTGNVMAITPSDPSAGPRAVCKLDESNWPVVSPDGSKVAYMNNQLCVLTVSGRKSVGFLGVFWNDGGGLVAWHPDGKRLAFSCFAQSRAGLWLANLETGRSRIIVDGAVWKPAWSKDGKHLLYVNNDTQRIYIVDTDKLPRP